MTPTEDHARDDAAPDLHAGLDEAVRRAAQAPTLVVACDYDGTLAPFVDDPTRAVPVPGAHIESKPTAAVLHVRPVSDPALRETAMTQAMAGPAAREGVFVTEGKNVVEIAVREASKGAAIERLVEQTGAEVAVFIGDDVTDERGFARLRDRDVGVKVGDGPTLAPHRVADIPAVVGLLERLAELRA